MAKNKETAPQGYAKIRGVRITPRKMGLIADKVRGCPVTQALQYLKFSPRKRTAGIFYALLQSASANARNALGSAETDLYVAEVLVGAGIILKRFRPRAKGSAFRINKRTSQLTITVRPIARNA